MRFMKVKGLKGILVANPWALDANPPRKAGQQRKVDGEGCKQITDWYDPCEEILQTEAMIERACQKGELSLLAECVADSHDEAAKKMAPKAAHAAKKGDA